MISVKDTGIGISPSDLPRIFERFYRCDQSRSQAGIGLGLSLARAIARAHGGDITATSLPNQGSTFTVTLPKFRAFPILNPALPTLPTCNLPVIFLLGSGFIIESREKAGVPAENPNLQEEEKHGKEKTFQNHSYRSVHGRGMLGFGYGMSTAVKHSDDSGLNRLRPFRDPHGPGKLQ